MRIGQSILPRLHGGIRAIRFNTTSATASCSSQWLYRSAQGSVGVLPCAYKNGMQRRSLRPSLNVFHDMQRSYVTGTWAARTMMPVHARTLLPCFFWKEHRTFTSEAPAESQKDKFKRLMQEYGKVVLLSHSTIWGLSLMGTYAFIQSMDLTAFIELLPKSIASHVDPSAGAFAIAFVLVKLTGPARLMIDFAITPTLAGFLRQTWLAGPLGLKKFTEDDKNAYKVVGRLARDRMIERAGQGRTIAKLTYKRIRDSKHTIKAISTWRELNRYLNRLDLIRLRAEYSKSIRRKLENLRSRSMKRRGK
mmetsp:Transcript_23614/g.76903  ORF Transcript_23614/g.76903 Transcript_23614/m.76903 type:complete len:306 (-) Transcript_23614:97-1014(-)